MSVSVRSSGHTQPRNATLSSTRHSHGGAVLRTTAAQNIVASRHSLTDQKFNPGGRTQSSAVDKKNTAVISIDELQRIRQTCTQNGFSSSFTGGASAYDLDEEQYRARERMEL